MDLEGNRATVLACLAGGAASIAASLLLGNGFLAVIASVFFFLALLLHKYGYFIIPFVTRGLRIVEIRDDYEIPPSQDIVIKRTKGGYLASVFVGVALNETSSGKTDAQKAMMMELFERALSSVKCVMKVSVILCNVDLADYIDSLKSRRSLAENRISKLHAPSQKGGEAARLEREIAHYTHQIEKLSGGERPMQVVAYAMTTADGLTREEAVSRARAQAQQISAVLSNSLGSSVGTLSGDHMRRCFDWEMAIPESAGKLRDELF